MTKSKLATYENLANNYGGKRLYPVTKISIHHMAGKMTARQCADYFARTDRIASSNYTIGWDGSIALSVPEEYRAYTTSSSWCDERAITIEVSNEDNNGGDWKITDKAYNALLDLVTDICRRYGIKDCSYTGDKDGVLQKHEWYAWTNCPGKYLGSKFPEISRIVNQRLRERKNIQRLNVNKSMDLTKSIGLYQIKNGTNVRLNPSMKSDVKRVTKNGEIVSVTEIKNGWAKIAKKNEWFWLDLSTQIKEFDVDVKTNTNIREKPTTNSKIVDRFIKVKSTKIREVKNGWGLINSKKGWIWLGLASLK